MKALKLAVAATTIAVSSFAFANPDHNSITWNFVAAPVALNTPKGNWLGSKMVNHFGAPSFGGRVDRTVQIGPDTRWVNVTQDQVIRFVAGDRAFDWNFATHTVAPIDLAQIAPPGFLPGPSPTVFLAPNPMYSGN